MTAVIFLAGIIIPAHVAFASLLPALSHSSPVVTKELEVYAGEQPPEDYDLDREVEGLGRFATDRGFDRFHLYGQSFGGAVALAYIARHPDRVASVALDEPATDFSDADRAAIAAQKLSEGPEDQRMQRFVQQFVRPGVELPPPPPPSDAPEMAKRPAGVAASIPALDTYRVDEADLRRYPGPAYVGYGALSNVRWEEMAERLSHVLTDCAVVRYEERHHADPRTTPSHDGSRQH
ncbi:alpha/beta fold hydrolase [Pseudonocardia saturnea]